MKIYKINGPILKCHDDGSVKVKEMVEAGPGKLIGEVIDVSRSSATVQIYDNTDGLKIGQDVYGKGRPLSIRLGPGLIGSILSGLGIPLSTGPSPAAAPAVFNFSPAVTPEEKVFPGTVLGSVPEYGIKHCIMVPPGITGDLVKIQGGPAAPGDTVAEIRTVSGAIEKIGLFHDWPVRERRPFKERLGIAEPFFSGQRVLDFIFPLGRGGCAAVPGGFGAGKTIIQHSIAKWGNADIVIYIGCGERGNEIAQILEEFPELNDPRTERPLMERTIIIANTSNMPVTARESSIYTGITIAEYYRDMGYDVVILADSTSRWAEALREISSRLEEIPAEEGYPAYLASRLAEYYERAGNYLCLSGRKGTITAIGAVSPQGGDFSEPVTQQTKRYIKSFWVLDKDLASERHFPAVSWNQSYSEYIPDLEGWWLDNSKTDWAFLRQKIKDILQEADHLENIVKIVGFESLPDKQKLSILAGDLVKKGFLQQNSYDENDAYCVIEKQIAIARAITDFYDTASDKLKKSVSYYKISGLPAIEKIVKLKFMKFPSDEIENALSSIRGELIELA